MNQGKDSRQPEHREQDGQRQRPLEDPEAEGDGALPGRAGGGLAGG